MATVLENKKILTPFVVGPEECRLAHPMQMPGHEVLVKACSEDTGGVFAVGLLLAKPMSGPPLHMHTREDEWFYIRSGEFTFQVANERFTAGPGTSVFAPRFPRHTPHLAELHGRSGGGPGDDHSRRHRRFLFGSRARSDEPREVSIADGRIRNRHAGSAPGTRKLMKGRTCVSTRRDEHCGHEGSGPALQPGYPRPLRNLQSGNGSPRPV